MTSSSEEYLDQLLASVNNEEQDNSDTLTDHELNSEKLRGDNTESLIFEEEFLDPEELDFLNLPEKTDLFPDRVKTPGFDESNLLSDDVDMPFSALPDFSQMEDFDLLTDTETEDEKKQDDVVTGSDSSGEDILSEQDSSQLDDILPGDDIPLQDNSDEEDAQSNPYENLGLDADMLLDLEDVDSLLADAEEIAKNQQSSSELEDLSNTDFSSEMVLDADLAEINSILEKSDNNEVVEDSLLSMLDDIKESDTEKGLFDNFVVLEDAVENENASSEKDKKAKKKKKPKKDRKENKKNSLTNQETDSFEQSALNAKEAEGESSDKKKKEKKSGEKKPGLLDRIKEFVFAPDEEDDSDNKEKPQKSSKDSSKKKDADKKGKSPDENELLEKELEAEDIKDLQNKKKKEKKEKKKEKKQSAKKEKPAKAKKERKKEIVEEEDNKKGKTIGPTGTFITLLCCFTLFAVIMILCYVVPTQLALAKGRFHYYRGDYVAASTILYGHKLGKSDKLLLQKSVLLGDLEIRLKKYESFCELDDKREALNALFEAKNACMDADFEANELGITEEVQIIEDKIDELLIVKYHLTQEEIEEICKMRSLYYTIAIDNLLAGKPYNELPAELERTDLGQTQDSFGEEDSNEESSSPASKDFDESDSDSQNEQREDDIELSEQDAGNGSDEELMDPLPEE